MSAQPGEEIGPEGRWFGDDFGENGLSGNAPSRFDGLHDEFKPRGNESSDLDQPFRSSQDEGKRPAVAMETASTDELMTGLFKKGLTDDDGDVYTSLMSSQSYKSSYDSSHVTETSKTFSADYSFSTKKDLLDDMPKSYNYMDISHSEERSAKHGLQDSPGRDALGGYMDKSPGRHEEEEEDDDEEENMGSALGSHSFPYVEEPSDEEMPDYRSYRNLGGTPQASPVKITLTESKPTHAKMEPQQRPVSTSALDTENVLSVGVKGVPTVTLSEPEDESPASSPNGSPTHKQFPVKQEVGSHDGSSAESGDSEIELVSEETTKASTNPFSQPPKTTCSNPFDHLPPAKGALGPGGTHAAPPTYSILREEREAELDSDLFIESASEESPKREQGLSAPKHIAPSPLVPTVTPPRTVTEPEPVQFTSTEKPKVQIKTEEEKPKAKPPTAAVTPEVRAADKPPAAETHKEDVKKTNLAVIFKEFSKQKAMDLLYWRNMKQSGAVFSSVLLLLFSLTQFSVVSVAAYLALAALSATISFRIYKSVLQAVQKTDEGHPFKAYLEIEMTLSQEQISKYADKILLYTNTCMKELRRLFLVQDLVDSLKFAVLMWLLTYVGALSMASRFSSSEWFQCSPCLWSMRSIRRRLTSMLD
ncbi:hypothetical protein WMY93_016991 [Mugilogobius chulae]|uniref:Reticulon n=1 Tax=Mugilogobius chulae TaxID=88201 RepID=A0AAW0NZ56_9GOBI